MLKFVKKIIGKFFYYTGILETRFVYAKPIEIKNKKILIIAPHPDDDVIGCGGTITKSIKNQCQIKVVYITDGSGGDPKVPKDELIRIRKNESKKSLEILGCDNYQFLDYPDLKLKCSEEIIKELLKILERFQPDLLLVPFFLDNHPDHKETVKIITEVLINYLHPLNCYNYEVWSTLYPNILVDISREINIKVKAINAHQSQIKNIDYGEKIKGLNCYRSLTAGKEVEYCEAFYKCSKEEYIKLAKELLK